MAFWIPEKSHPKATSTHAADIYQFSSFYFRKSVNYSVYEPYVPKPEPVPHAGVEIS